MSADNYGTDEQFLAELEKHVGDAIATRLVRIVRERDAEIAAAKEAIDDVLRVHTPTPEGHCFWCTNDPRLPIDFPCGHHLRLNPAGDNT